MLLALAALFLFSSCSQKDKVDIPLPEHPRPNFERSLWQNLNGTWRFEPDSLDVGIAENWQVNSDQFGHEILVPFSWASPASGIKMPDVDIAWYARNFKLANPEIWEGKQVYLNFCASDFNTTVWINGEKVGAHAGGYTPFDFDVSNFLRAGVNSVVVRVEDKELKNRPSGKQYYGNAKGIWQTVYLEARPQMHIKALFFTPDIDNNEVAVKVVLSQPPKNNLLFSLRGSGINFQAKIDPGTRDAEFTIPIGNILGCAKFLRCRFPANPFNMWR